MSRFRDFRNLKWGLDVLGFIDAQSLSKKILGAYLGLWENLVEVPYFYVKLHFYDRIVWSLIGAS